jgi:hypothetical protein
MTEQTFKGFLNGSTQAAPKSVGVSNNIPSFKTFVEQPKTVEPQILQSF